MKKILLILFVFLGMGPLSGQLMYPGDTNNDGRANHLDLLPIGLAFGAQGEPRPAASENWFAQEFIPWPIFLPTTPVNGAFINSNGDGIIDTLDLDAIVANYDMMQDSTMPFPWQHNIQCLSCPPPILSISYNLDSVEVNGAFQAFISVLYPETIPFDLGALGLALELSYDPELVVETSVVVTPNTDEGTLMFVTATSEEAAGYRLPAPGRVQISAAGRGQNAFFQDSTGVARIDFIVIDDIQRDTVFRAFKLEIESLLFLNVKEELLFPMVHNSDSVVLFQVLDQVLDRPLADILQIFPNPVRDVLRVQAAQGIYLDRLRLWNNQGVLVGEEPGGFGAQWKFETGGLPPGIYWLEIQREGEKFTQKILLH
ncbi:MAG: hypothetical protein IPH04_12965 [Saprospirales bacterium]|nr:hypothetical protein [Saprospirales bacterium]